MVKAYGLSAESVGVRVMAPVLGSRLRPVGKLPTDTLKVTGATPPLSAMVWSYATPTVQSGNVNVVMLSELMVTLYAWLPVAQSNQWR